MGNTERIQFYSDQYLLHGVLHFPSNPYPPVVIGCHGLFATSESPKQTALAKLCVNLGIAYFRFDHRGCGQSEGDFEEVTTLRARCRDLKSAIKTIVQRVGTRKPAGLFGSSMGGAVCIAVAGELETGPKVVVAAPLSTHTIKRPQKPDPPDSIIVSDNFYNRNLTFDIHPSIAKLNNILIFHGDQDEIVPVQNAHQLFSGTNHPKKLIIQKNGDHAISDPNHQEEFQTEAIKWFRQGFDI